MLGAGKLNKEKGWDIKIHVDGASGAFVVPFLYPDLKWDFRCENVVSVNASGHKCDPQMPPAVICLCVTISRCPMIIAMTISAATLSCLAVRLSWASVGMCCQHDQYITLVLILHCDF